MSDRTTVTDCTRQRDRTLMPGPELDITPDQIRSNMVQSINQSLFNQAVQSAEQKYYLTSLHLSRVEVCIEMRWKYPQGGPKK